MVFSQTNSSGFLFLHNLDRQALNHPASTEIHHLKITSDHFKCGCYIPLVQFENQHAVYKDLYIEFKNRLVILIEKFRS